FLPRRGEEAGRGRVVAIRKRGGAQVERERGVRAALQVSRARRRAYARLAVELEQRQCRERRALEHGPELRERLCAPACLVVAGEDALPLEPRARPFPPRGRP